MGKNRRKKYFLSKGTQPGLLLGVTALVLILVIIAGGLFYLLANRELSIEYYKAHSSIRYVMKNLLPWLLLVNLLGIAVALFLAVFYTHRIAGPLYRVQKDIRKIGEGFLTTRVKTRKGDQLKDLETEVNNMIQELEKNFLLVKGDFLKLENILEELDKVAQTKDLSGARLQEMSKQIHSYREEINRKLSFFKTE
jgi:methyl-accepting chemotaxis protein